MQLTVSYCWCALNFLSFYPQSNRRFIFHIHYIIIFSIYPFAYTLYYLINSKNPCFGAITFLSLLSVAVTIRFIFNKFHKILFQMNDRRLFRNEGKLFCLLTPVLNKNIFARKTSR